MDRLEKYMSGKDEIRVVRGNGHKIDYDTDLEIERLYIDEEQRKVGKASSVIRDIINFGKEFGFERIWVFANPDDPPGENGIKTREELVKFYEKFGFEVYWDSRNGIKMKLELK